MRQMAQNRIKYDCLQHRRVCDLFCTFTRCTADKVMCEKCVPDHLAIHQKQFIYHIDNLSEVHGFEKVGKMKDVLVANKLEQEVRLAKIYRPFDNLLAPLNKRLEKFVRESSDLTKSELGKYLSTNKGIIESTVIKKSDPITLKKNPQLMLDETFAELNSINEKEVLMKENADKFAWYADSVEELLEDLLRELGSMCKVGITLIDNYDHIQKNNFDENLKADRENHHEQSFMKRYMNSHKVAERSDKHNLELVLINSNKEVQRKDNDIKRAQHEIKEKVTKIEELNAKIEGLQEELLQWEQKLEREENDKLEAIEREKKKKKEYLITNDIVIDEGRSISVEKKQIEEKFFVLIHDIVPNPVQLILNSHQLTPSQLDSFMRFTSVQVLKMSFTKCNMHFLKSVLEKFQHLHTLELNSAGIDDEKIAELGHYFSKIKHLYIMDNQITDNGLELMFENMRHSLESLYVSYNKLTHRAIEIINSYSYEIKTLHISKNFLKKGGVLIGRHLKELEELFIGGTEIQKDGFLSICRNCIKMKRLSLVATELSTDIVSQILLALQKLEWLDISYTNLNKDDLEKVEKLKIFNKGIEIVSQI